MGGVLSSTYARIFGRQEAPIIMLGLDAAGKTTILYKLRLGEVVTTVPTIGFNVETLEFSKRASLVSFTTWDVGGRAKIRPLLRHYYQQAKALVFVVDSNDKERWEQASDEMMQVLHEDECRDWPLLVLANKQDLPNTMSVREVTDKLKLHYLQNRKWYIQGCSALTGNGLFDGLEWLSQAMGEGEGDKGPERKQMQSTDSGKKDVHRAEKKQDLTRKILVPGEQSSDVAQVQESDVETDVPESVATEAIEQEL